MSMRFRSWKVNDSVSLSVYTPDACGIYVLEFSDDEEYVGQTRHLLSRFSAHRRRWPDEVVGIRFCEVEPDRLDEAERDAVALRVRIRAHEVHDGSQPRRRGGVPLQRVALVLRSAHERNGTTNGEPLATRVAQRLRQGPSRCRRGAVIRTDQPWYPGWSHRSA